MLEGIYIPFSYTSSDHIHESSFVLFFLLVLMPNRYNGKLKGINYSNGFSSCLINCCFERGTHIYYDYFNVMSMFL